MNFEFGLGFALWGIAAHLAVRKRPWQARLLVDTISVTVLFVAHFFSLGIYGVTLGILELWHAYRQKQPYREAASRLLILATPAAVLFGVMQLSGGSIGSDGTMWALAFKPLWFFRIMNGYNMTVSAISALVLMSLLYYLHKRGFLKLRPVGWWLLAGFGALYLIIPSTLLDTSFVDLRLIPAAVMILPAFSSLSLPNRRSTIAVLAVACGITLVNLTVVLLVWSSYRADYAAIVDSFHKIDRGSKVLIGSSDESADPPFDDLTRYPMYYAPILVVHYANAFVPNLFTAVGKQPVRPRAAVQDLAIPYGGPMPLRVLGAVASGQTSSDIPLFIRSWTKDYDYLYVLGPHVVNPMPELLEELDSSAGFVLFRIRHVP